MEGSEFPPAEGVPLEIVGNRDLEQRYVELWLRSHMIGVHEDLARAWEGLDQSENLTRAELAEKQQLERTLFEGIGVHPVERRALEAKIESVIAGGCRETLDQIMTTFCS